MHWKLMDHIYFGIKQILLVLLTAHLKMKRKYLFFFENINKEKWVYFCKPHLENI